MTGIHELSTSNLTITVLVKLSTMAGLSKNLNLILTLTCHLGMLRETAFVTHYPIMSVMLYCYCHHRWLSLGRHTEVNALNAVNSKQALCVTLAL